MGWGWYSSSHDRKRQKQAAEREAAKIKDASPVVIDGKVIAKTFWGKAWCELLEEYSDIDTRLPRGRTYVRSGHVVDLKANGGSINAKVLGSSLYKVTVSITPIEKNKWTSLIEECRGSIGSLVELLEGTLSDSVMRKMISHNSGFFPSLKEITYSCSCPDWASMCKHVAAVLYGIGNRMDTCPDLLFQLRNVDPSELTTHTLAATPITLKSKRILDSVDIFEVFEVREEDGAKNRKLPKSKSTTKTDLPPQHQKRTPANPLN